MPVDLIKQQFKISLSRSSVSCLLKQLGLSPQRPLRRAYQQNPETVAQWLKQDFPHICEEAQKVRATIYFADEAGVRSDYHSGTTWGIRGQTPVVASTGARFGLNVISVVNRHGKLRFMVFNGRLNGDLFIQFLHRPRFHRREAAVVLSAYLFSRTQSRRTGLEPPEQPYNW